MIGFSPNGIAPAGSIGTAQIADGAVTFAKLAQSVKNGLDPAGERAVSGNITIDADDNMLLVSASADITLPAASEGRMVSLQKTTASLLTVNIIRAGSEKINNVAANYAATDWNSALYVAATLYCDGTDWWYR